MRTETALETLMVKSEEKKKKVIDFYFVGLLGRSTFGRSADLLVAQTECVSDIMCVALFFLFHSSI